MKGRQDKQESSVVFDPPLNLSDLREVRITHWIEKGIHEVFLLWADHQGEWVFVKPKRRRGVVTFKVKRPKNTTDGGKVAL